MMEHKFQITRDDFGDLKMTFLKPYRDEMRQELHKWMQKMADDSKVFLSSMVADPKHLHKTLTSEAEWLGAGAMVWLRGEFGTNVKYAPHVEYGTKTPITPRTAKYMVFKYRKGPGSHSTARRRGWIRALSVKGQDAKPFLRLSFGANKEGAVDALMQAIRRAWAAKGKALR